MKKTLRILVGVIGAASIIYAIYAKIVFDTSDFGGGIIIGAGFLEV